MYPYSVSLVIIFIHFSLHFRHGLARMEYYVLNDMELSFKDVLKRCLEAKPLTNQKDLEECRVELEPTQ